MLSDQGSPYVGRFARGWRRLPEMIPGQPQTRARARPSIGIGRRPARALRNTRGGHGVDLGGPGRRSACGCSARRVAPVVRTSSTTSTADGAGRDGRERPAHRRRGAPRRIAGLRSGGTEASKQAHGRKFVPRASARRGPAPGRTRARPAVAARAAPRSPPRPRRRSDRRHRIGSAAATPRHPENFNRWIARRAGPSNTNGGPRRVDRGRRAIAAARRPAAPTGRPHRPHHGARAARARTAAIAERPGARAASGTPPRDTTTSSARARHIARPYAAADRHPLGQGDRDRGFARQLDRQLRRLRGARDSRSDRRDRRSASNAISRIGCGRPSTGSVSSVGSSSDANDRRIGVAEALEGLERHRRNLRPDRDAATAHRRARPGHRRTARRDAPLPARRRRRRRIRAGTSPRPSSIVEISKGTNSVQVRRRPPAPPARSRSSCGAPPPSSTRHARPRSGPDAGPAVGSAHESAPLIVAGNRSNCARMETGRHRHRPRRPTCPAPSECR